MSWRRSAFNEVKDCAPNIDSFLPNSNRENNYLLILYFIINIQNWTSKETFRNFLFGCMQIFCNHVAHFFSIVRVIIDAQFAHHEFTVNSIRLLFLPLHLHFKKCCENFFLKKECRRPLKKLLYPVFFSVFTQQYLWKR